MDRVVVIERGRKMADGSSPSFGSWRGLPVTSASRCRVPEGDARRRLGGIGRPALDGGVLETCAASAIWTSSDSCARSDRARGRRGPAAVARRALRHFLRREATPSRGAMAAHRREGDRDGLRNRWVVAITLLLALFGARRSPSSAARPPARSTSARSTVTVVSLSSLDHLPVAADRAAAVLRRHRGRARTRHAALLLAYPVARWQVIARQVPGPSRHPRLRHASSATAPPPRSAVAVKGGSERRRLGRLRLADRLLLLLGAVFVGHRLPRQRAGARPRRRRPASRSALAAVRALRHGACSACWRPAGRRLSRRARRRAPAAEPGRCLPPAQPDRLHGRQRSPGMAGVVPAGTAGRRRCSWRRCCCGPPLPLAAAWLGFRQAGAVIRALAAVPRSSPCWRRAPEVRRRPPAAAHARRRPRSATSAAWCWASSRDPRARSCSRAAGGPGLVHLRARRDRVHPPARGAARHRRRLCQRHGARRRAGTGRGRTTGSRRTTPSSSSAAAAAAAWAGRGGAVLGRRRGRALRRRVRRQGGAARAIPQDYILGGDGPGGGDAAAGAEAGAAGAEK